MRQLEPYLVLAEFDGAPAGAWRNGSGRVVRHAFTAQVSDRRAALDGGRHPGNDGDVVPRSLSGWTSQQAPTRLREEALLRLLYEQHFQPLLTLMLRLTGGDRQRSEDIVQETLLRAWRNAHRLGAGEDRPLRQWLITVARRIAIDDYRSEKARPTETYDHELDTFAISDDTDQTDQLLSVIVINEALRSLSEAHREILVHTYFRGRTVARGSRRAGLATAPPSRGCTTHSTPCARR